MKRRRFLTSVAIILPAAMVSTELFFSSCNRDIKEEYFSEENIKLLDEIGETIIPATSSSPGAKAAKIGAFMKIYVTDCYTPDEQNIFWEGINKIKKLSKSKHGNEFPGLTISQKQDILRSLENEPNDSKNTNKVTTATGDAVQTGKEQEIKNTVNVNAPRFYPMLKELVLFGFFTSEPGATKAARYIQTPGSYQGDVPYKKGDKVWAA
ncbi:MAG: gluconate 2-dehydrogenase subunit 3 family protein [Ginsengibacter sp.]